jgi:hypothetical protein
MIYNDQIIEVTITNQGAHYRSLGYSCKQRDILNVPVQHLHKGTWKLVKCRCDDCNNDFERPYAQVSNLDYHRCYECTRIHIGKIMNTSKISERNKIRSGKHHPRWNENKTEFKKYYTKVMNITRKTYNKYKNVINPNNLPRTRCGQKDGFQLDHKISIKKGFMFGINPKIIGSLDNLQMLTWQENRAKHF